MALLPDRLNCGLKATRAAKEQRDNSDGTSFVRLLPFGLRRFIAAFHSTQLGKSFSKLVVSGHRSQKGCRAPQGKAAINFRSPN